MIPIPPTIKAKLIMLLVSTLISTVIPFALQNRPRLKWVWDKVGPRIVDRVEDKVEPEDSTEDGPVD